jgi:hypothetical protein
MEVRFSPEVEAKVVQMASDVGCPTDHFVESVLQGYFDDLAGVRQMLDRRYDEMEAGTVELIDGDTFFEELRLREEALFASRNC